jgi:hypothetical protein
MKQTLQTKWGMAGWLALGLLLVAITPGAYGQATATLTGIVADQSKAVVPGADITLIDEASGDTRKTISNDEGYFTFTALMAKTYKLRVEMAGFQTWERIGIRVHSGDKIHIADISMVPGAPSEVVTVTGGANQIIPVDSGEKSTTITAAQIQNTPVVGRDATELLRILPGMVGMSNGVENRARYTGENIGINGNGAGGKQSAIGNFSGNGGRTDSIEITSDGVHVADPGCNCAAPVNPNVDMIQEFKVQGASFSAENSKGPVVVSTVAKSGGSEFHGEGYFYTRQSAWNSADSWVNYNHETKPNNDYYYPGFNIGGPLLLPWTNFNRDRNKMFFFAGLEYIDQNIDTGVRRAVVPTEAWRRGDFSDAAYIDKITWDKWGIKSQPTKNGFVDGKAVVPLDPGGRALVGLLPLPNIEPDSPGADGYNWRSLSTVDQPMIQFLTRVDYSISDNTKLYTRYNMQREDQPQQFGMWWDHADVPTPSRILAKNASDSISTNLSHVFNPTLTNEFTFGYTFIDFPNKWEDPSKISRTQLKYPYQGLWKNGSDVIPGWTDWGGGVAQVIIDGGFNPVLFATKHLFSVGDNVTKVMSTHTVKAGFYYEWVNNKQPNHDHDNGRFEPATWAAHDTGNAYANMLLGVTSGYYEVNQSIVLDEGYHVVEGYLQDSWKARPNLTLEFGLRLSHLGPWYGRNGAAMAVFDPARYSNNPADLTQYTGIVTNLTDPNVPLSGTNAKAIVFGPRFGAAYSVRNNTVLRGGFGVYNFHDPQQQDPLKNPPQTLASSVGNLYLWEVDQVSPSLAKVNANVVRLDDDKLPVTYNWNFTISQRLPRQMLLETSYVGNTSRNLLTGGINLNAVPENTVLLPIGQSVGDWNNYRPRANYGDINESIHDDYSNYHSLQMLLAKQTGRLTYSAAYTFSKVLGIRSGAGETGASLGNTFRRRERQYGVLAFDRTHVFNIAYSYLVPDIFRGNSFLQAAVNGWQFTGITTFQSGVNLGAQLNSFNLEVRGHANGEEFTLGQEHVTGTNSVSLQPVLTCDPRKGLKDGQYINPGCFAAPQPGQNGMFQFPYLRGPGYMNHDISIFKNFQMGRNEDRKLQLRFAAHNFLNHPMKSFVNNEEAGLRLQFMDGQMINSQFGYPHARYGRRIMQAAIKFMF